MGNDRERIDARIGTTLSGKYKLVRVLGVGGMGAVFEGTNTWTDRRVAIKLMLTGNGTVDPELVQRFMREAKAATKIAHPNIVDVLDMGQDADGALFIVQEFLAGSDLRRLLDERGSLSPRESVEIVAPVMSALIAAHKHGIVHRDLKPENIFLTKSPSGVPVPKLIDFGIAKMNDGAERGLTRTGAAMGTPHYMSPEQARGDKVDAQTDVWAMGVVLYEALSGQCPYDGENYNQLMVRIATEPPRRIEEAAPRIRAQLAAVVHRALEADRTKRFRSMAEFLGALLDVSTDTDPRWNDSIRTTIQNVAPIRDDDLVTPQYAPDAVANPPDRADAVSGRTTLGRTVREIEATRAPSRAWALGAAAVGVVVAVTVGASLARRASVPPQSASSRPVNVAPVATAPAAAAGAPTTFVAVVAVTPPGAEILVDGAPAGAGSLSRTFPRDGARHVLVASAPGHETARIEFVDASPPASIGLVPVVASDIANGRPSATAVTRTRGTAGTGVTRQAPPPVTPPPAHVAPIAHPSTGANGAPIGEE